MANNATLKQAMKAITGAHQPVFIPAIFTIKLAFSGAANLPSEYYATCFKEGSFATILNDTVNPSNWKCGRKKNFA